MNCDTARVYCGAVADGELDVVPDEVLTHIRACHDCSIEVKWQREAQAALSTVLADEPAALPMPAVKLNRPRRINRTGLWALGAVAAMVLVAGSLFIGNRAAIWSHPSPDVAMTDAAAAYSQPAAFSSTDVAAISAWSAGRGMQVDVMPITGALATGARVSTIQGHPVVTVIYTAASGTIEVTRLAPDLVAGWPASEAAQVGPSPVGMLLRGREGVLVVAPDMNSLHVAMAAVQAD